MQTSRDPSCANFVMTTPSAQIVPSFWKNCAFFAATMDLTEPSSNVSIGIVTSSAGALALARQLEYTARSLSASRRRSSRFPSHSAESNAFAAPAARMHIAMLANVRMSLLY